jgi:hypothetical protein
MKAVMAVPAAEGTESGEKVLDFEALMAGEQKRIFLLCLRLLHNRDEADSTTQDYSSRPFGRWENPANRQFWNRPSGSPGSR